MANESWRTAITRRDKRTRNRALTAPTRTLIESEYMGTMHWGPPSTNQHSGGLILSVLDFGAGKSFDADLIGEMHPGIETAAYDPNAPRLSETIATDVVPSREHYDLVLVNFVLNVQQTRAEAMEVLKAAMSHVRYAGYIWVATRSKATIEKEAQNRGWGAPNADGAYRSRTIKSTGGSTWQLGLDSADIEAMVAQSGQGFSLVNTQGDISLGKDCGWALAIRL